MVLTEQIKDSFLGVNCESGFFSLYEEFIAGRARVYVIKGGPGTGKSTLMKRLAERAEAAGEAAERIHCSSDPESLDGVFLPGRNLCVVDGTPPHTVEPPLPGAVGRIVDLYPFWREAPLRERAADIKERCRRSAALYRRAYLYFGAAARLSREMRELSASCCDAGKMRSYAERLVSRTVRKGGSGREEKRFAAALTPDGKTFFPPPMMAGERRLVLEDETGASLPVLETVYHAAKGAGMAVNTFFSPLMPRRLSGLSLPEAGLSLWISDSLQKLTPLPYCRVSLSRFLLPEKEAACRVRLGFLKKSREEILKEGCALLRECRENHAALEEIYRPAVDFGGVTEMTERLCDEILR